MYPLSSKVLACCTPVLIELQSSCSAEAKKAKAECMPALASPQGEICADGMAFDQAKQLCCKSRRPRAAPCFPALTTPQGQGLCPDWIAFDQAKQLCREKNARQTGSAGQKKGKNGR